MIAFGLCMMGGCFAQNADTSLSDAYWPAEMVEIPSSSNGSVGLYEYSEIPAVVSLDECRVYTRQKVLNGIASFFYVMQNKVIGYNFYVSVPVALGRQQLDLQYSKNAQTQLFREYNKWDYPLEVEFMVSEDGASVWGDGALFMSGLRTEWKPGAAGGPLRLLDARKGQKEFYVSHGTWGHKWYLLPMKSVTKVDAVFDVETNTLVEL